LTPRSRAALSEQHQDTNNLHSTADADADADCGLIAAMLAPYSFALLSRQSDFGHLAGAVLSTIASGSSKICVVARNAVAIWRRGPRLFWHLD